MSYRSQTTGVYTFEGQNATTHVLSDEILNFNNEVDDILVIQLSIDENRTVTTPAGWNVIVNLDSGTETRLWIAWLRATSANVVPPDITISGNDSLLAYTYFMRGCPTASNPIGQIVTNTGNSISPTWLTVTPDASDSSLVYAGSMDIDSMQTIGPTIPPVEANDIGPNSGIYGVLFAPDTTAIPQQDGTASNIDEWVTAVVEFLDDGTGQRPFYFPNLFYEEIFDSNLITSYGSNVWRDFLTDSGQDFYTGSALDVQSFDANTDVDPITDFITITAHPYSEGDVVRAEANGNTLPTGIIDGNYYFVNPEDANNITLRDANTAMTVDGDWFRNGGTAKATIDITAVGTGTCQFTLCKNILVSMDADGDFRRPPSQNRAGLQYQTSGIEFVTPRDFTGESFYCRFDPLSLGESFVVAIDSDGDYRTYQTSSSVQYARDEVFQIDFTHPSFKNEFGTFDITSVKYILFGIFRDGLNNRTKGLKFYFEESAVSRPINVLGGRSEIGFLEVQAEAALFTNALSGSALGAQFQFLQSVKIGDGHNVSDSVVEFGDSAKSIGFFPSANGVDSFQNYVKDLGLNININPSSSFVLTDSQIISTATFPITVDPNRPAGATINLDRNTFIESELTIQDDDSLDGASFIGGARPIFNAAEVTGPSFVNVNEADGYILLDTSSDVTDASFSTDTPSDYAIEIDAAGTFDFDYTFTGFTTDLNVTATTGTVTINVAQGTDTPTFVTAGATVVVNAPVLDITFTNLTDANVQIVEDDLSTVNTRVLNQTGTYVWSAPQGATGIWYYCINRVGYDPIISSFDVTTLDFSVNGTQTQKLTVDGNPLYTGATSPFLTVVPNPDGSRMNLRIGNGKVGPQAAFDETEDALSTEDGMTYLINGGGELGFITVATGTYLFEETNVRLIRDNPSDALAEVGALMESTDGIIADVSNGSVIYGQVTLDVNVASVNDISVTGPDDFKADVSAMPELQEIVDGVWDEPLTGSTHNDPTSAGRRLRQASVWLSVEGEIVGTPTLTQVDTNIANGGDDFYNDHTFVFVSGAQQGQARIIADYITATKTFVFDEPLTGLPSAGDEFAVLANHEHTITQIKDGVLQGEIESGYSLEESMRLQNAILLGKASSAPNATVFRDIADTKDRVTSITDDNGNRTDITLDET